jgi:hypothetical protein
MLRSGASRVKIACPGTRPPSERPKEGQEHGTLRPPKLPKRLPSGRRLATVESNGLGRRAGPAIVK